MLPTKYNLLKKGVVKDSMCPICGVEEESVSHISWECASARDVWGGSTRKLQKLALRGMDFISSIFEEVAVHGEIEEVELFSVIARRIWLRRNQLVHESSFLHPTQLLRVILVIGGI